MRTFPNITILFFLAYCCFWAVSASIAEETSEESRTNWATEAYKKNCHSVIFIQGDKVEGRHTIGGDVERTFNGMGSGAIIDERGYIITNYHVVKDLQRMKVKTYDEQDYIATLVAKDTETDLAIIKINPKTPLKPIRFGRSHDLVPGEVCMAIGNPYGYLFTLTDGRIGAVNRDIPVNDTALVYRSAIQTDTAINPGNSGGPLINVYGEMIGINVAMRQEAAGIAFASPVDQVVKVAAKLMSEMIEQQISLGMTISQIEPNDYDIIKRFIIRVESVESNSPAAQAGIQQGDVITGIGKEPIKNTLDFYRALLDLKANDEIGFTFIRNKKLQDTAVAMGASRGRQVAGTFARRSVSPQSSEITPKTAHQAKPSAESASYYDKLVWEHIGIQYSVIPKQEFTSLQYGFTSTVEGFIEKLNGGVRIKAVRPKSPAEQVGMMAGDFIVGFGEYESTSENDVRYVARDWVKMGGENGIVQADVIRDNTHYKAEMRTR